jgi:hypothetical protein
MVNIFRRCSNPLPFEGGVEIGGALSAHPVMIARRMQQSEETK